MKVGIQLFSVKQNMQKDVVNALKQVSEIGYKYVEVANHNALEDFGTGFGLPVEDMKNLLKETGLTVISAHVAPLTLENIDNVLDYHSQIGTKTFCLSGFFMTKKDALEFCELVKQIGPKCREKGIHLLYHNHAHEFLQTDEGEVLFDIAMENTSPEDLGIQLDTYWAIRGGADPVEVLKKYGKRVKSVHQKDYPAGFEDEMDLSVKFENKASNFTMEGFMAAMTPDSFTEIGKGVIDIQSIINAAKEYGDVDYIILEQDATKLDEIESIKVSMEEFKKFEGISFE